MGQIISSAAKPKRCNANQLSQVPTPAAGEYILVSSDNSMNAAGQGNFDCYIVGNGRDAATALELKKINTEIYTTIETYVSVDFSSLTKNNKYINSSNQWVASGADYNNSYNVSVDNAKKLRITGRGPSGSIIAFLKSNSTVGNAVNFCDDYPRRIVIPANTTTEYSIPTDCTLVYVFNRTYADDMLPASFDLLRETQANHLDVLQSQVEELSTQVEDIDVDAITQLETQVNGGNRDVTITLEQGYAQSNGTSSIQVFTNLNTRVLSCVLRGAYNIKTNADYVIRGVTAWNGGTATEGTLPTSNITGVTNSTNLVTQAALTEYNCDGTFDYTIITFCKEDASATISPSENIVESCVDEVVGIEQKVQNLEANVGTYRVVRKALFMGDSINYGLASYFNDTKSGVREVTTNRISDYFAQMKGVQVDNIAARGTGYVADTRNLGNGWEKAQVTDYSNYNLVCICLGINDYIQHVNIGTLEANAEGTVIGNMTRIINKIMTDNPLCKVVIFSPYNSWGQVCDDSWSEYQVADYYGDESTDYALGYAIGGHTLTDYIAAIDSVCAAYHIQHVKLSESGMINKANIKKVLADGLHPIVDVRPMLAAELFGRKMYD